ncbi:REP element-mobilizing transposase RayT [bacterium JGI 053]|nr:REP element-mobilizing transposase RayT [bacterium JGI 053]
MRQAYTQLYLHLVWATWDRMALVRPEFREAIYGCIQEQVKKHRCEPLAIGGMEDHVHLLIRFPTTARISEVVQHAKGASSNLMTQVLDRGGFFKWQGYYGAFTVAKSQVPRVRNYILHQEEHHLGGTLNPALEQTCEELESTKVDCVPL